jgi:hypothetical protein
VAGCCECGGESSGSGSTVSEVFMRHEGRY